MQVYQRWIQAAAISLISLPRFDLAGTFTAFPRMIYQSFVTLGYETVRVASCCCILLPNAVDISLTFVDFLGLQPGLCC